MRCEALTVPCCCALTEAGVCDLQAALAQNVFLVAEISTMQPLEGLCWIPLHTLPAGCFSQPGETSGAGTIASIRPADTSRVSNPEEILAASGATLIWLRPAVFDVCVITESHVKAQPNGFALG